ncbi:MAG: hypothetical protein ACOWWO_15240 [Peptococcaceae bacterium]
MKDLKINPLWIALLTFWVPNFVAKTSLPETPKTVLIWVIVAFQLYLLYKGIEIIRANKKK